MRIPVVSELRQMPFEAPVEQRGLLTHTEAGGCGEKCPMRSALVWVGVPSSAPPDSISKRA